MYLPDNNLWLALAFPSHAHDVSAKAWMQTVTDKNDCCFCRVTQMGFLRLATNPKVLGSTTDIDLKKFGEKSLWDLAVLTVPCRPFDDKGT